MPFDFKAWLQDMTFKGDEITENADKVSAKKGSLEDIETELNSLNVDSEAFSEAVATTNKDLKQEMDSISENKKEVIQEAKNKFLDIEMQEAKIQALDAQMKSLGIEIASDDVYKEFDKEKSEIKELLNSLDDDIQTSSDTYSLEPADFKQGNFKERVDKAKDTVFGKESAYDSERFEKAGIKGAFDKLPRNRREAVYEAFENAPDNIKSIINSLSSDLSVESTTGNNCCHYDLVAKKIRMEDSMDNNEYAEVFSHEYGHFVDNKKGNVSDTYEFREAMSKDLANYDRSTEVGRQNFDRMINDLMSSDAAFDRAVSDNMSAYFKNDPEVVQRYFDEGIDYYQHDNSYWLRHGNREAEIYANSFGMMAQDNKASCEFMERYFPNTWEQFKKML